MFVFGHLGVGRALVRPWRERLPLVALSIGMLLPDLIDKPLYYARVWPYITCTRTFGHTGVLLLAIAGAGLMFRSRALKAVAVGEATHLMLDALVDLAGGAPESSAMTAILWPLMRGGHFYTYYFQSMAAHAADLLSWPTALTEAIGLYLLWRERRAGSLTPARDPSSTG